MDTKEVNEENFDDNEGFDTDTDELFDGLTSTSDD